MASGFGRARQFAALVDGTSTVGRERHAALLGVVAALEAVPPPELRPAYAAQLRDRLLAEADTALRPATGVDRDDSPATATPTTRSTRERRLATALGGLALVGATATVAVASQVALPGDTLYPVKRALEDSRTSLAVGDTSTGEVVLSHATERLVETASLTRRPEIDVPATETGLRDFTSQAGEAATLLTTAYADTGQDATIAGLRDFTADSIDRLIALEPMLPDQARDELVAAADAVVVIDRDATDVCSTCGGAGVAELPVELTSALPVAPVDPTDPGTDGAAGSGNGQPSGTPSGQPSVPGVTPTPLTPLTPLPSGSPTRLPTPTQPTPTSTSPTRPTSPPTTVPTSAQPTRTPTRTPTVLPTLPTISPTLPTVLPTISPTLPTISPTLPTILPTLPTVLPTLPTVLPTLPVGDDLGTPQTSPLP